MKHSLKNDFFIMGIAGFFCGIAQPPYFASAPVIGYLFFILGYLQLLFVAEKRFFNLKKPKSTPSDINNSPQPKTAYDKNNLWLICKHTFLLGWMFGFIYFLTCGHWLAFAPYNGFGSWYALISILALIFIPCLIGLYKGFLLSVYVIICYKLPSFPQYLKLRLILWALLSVVFEYLQINIYSGFPLGLSAYIFCDSNIAQLCFIAGIWGLSFFAFVHVILIYETLHEILCINNLKLKISLLKRLISPVILIKALIYLLSFIIAYYYGTTRLSDSNTHYKIQTINNYVMSANNQNNEHTLNPPSNDNITNPNNLKIAIVQINNYQKDKAQKAFSNCLKITKTILLKHAEIDLIVWPETIIEHPSQKSTLIKQLCGNGNKSAFIIGGLRFQILKSIKKENDSFVTCRKIDLYNTCYFINNYGQLIDYYDKMHIVPFGEYLPFNQYLPKTLTKLYPMLNLMPGSKCKAFLLKQWRIMPLICFEAMFIDEILNRINHLNKRQKFKSLKASHAVDMLLNVTNDSWFKGTIGIAQHFAITRLLAIASNKIIIRSNIGGISAIINNKGQVISSLPANSAGFICANFIKLQRKNNTKPRNTKPKKIKTKIIS